MGGQCGGRVPRRRAEARDAPYRIERRVQVDAVQHDKELVPDHLVRVHGPERLLEAAHTVLARLARVSDVVVADQAVQLVGAFGPRLANGYTHAQGDPRLGRLEAWARRCRAPYRVKDGVVSCSPPQKLGAVNVLGREQVAEDNDMRRRERRRQRADNVLKVQVVEPHIRAFCARGG